MDTDEELEAALAERNIALEQDEDDDSVLIGRSGCGSGIRVRKPQNAEQRRALYRLLTEHFIGG
ncbi:MAG: hypothetical protein H7124_01295 [Phycisphaerales bacterium]|nr:hypothetical protein [Hyphomonadaceae bacterium]